MSATAPPTERRRQFMFVDQEREVLATISRGEQIAADMRALAAHTRETALIRWDAREEREIDEGEGAL